MLYIYVPEADSGGKVRLASLFAKFYFMDTKLLTVLSPGTTRPMIDW